MVTPCGVSVFCGVETVTSGPTCALLRKLCHDARANIVRSGEYGEEKEKKFFVVELGYIRGRGEGG